MYKTIRSYFSKVYGSLFSQLRFTGYGLALRVSVHGLKIPHPSLSSTFTVSLDGCDRNQDSNFLLQIFSPCYKTSCSTLRISRERTELTKTHSCMILNDTFLKFSRMSNYRRITHIIEIFISGYIDNYNQR